MENKIPYYKRDDVKKRNAERMKKKYHNMTPEEKKQFLERRKIVMKKYREEHREELNAKMREYNRLYPDKKRKSNKKYYYGIRDKNCSFDNENDKMNNLIIIEIGGMVSFEDKEKIIKFYKRNIKEGVIIQDDSIKNITVYHIGGKIGIEVLDKECKRDGSI